MFTDWPSELIPQNGWGDEYSISAFKDTIPWNVGRDFVAGTAKHLYESLGLKKPKLQPESKIVHDKQLQILMPAIGYGLSFPLNEHEILRNCVYVYNEWLSALLPEPKPSVPAPILKDPNHYATIIINHFYYIFVPRTSQAVDEINRQALLCHRVLRTLQDIAKNSMCLNEETWQTLLIFLLHINSALLSPPAVKNDAGEQLGDRVLSVLFETWLLACARCFPPPPLWNALRESCQRWRHRKGLIDQWNRICGALTVKLLSFIYGPNFIFQKMSDEDLSIIPSKMTNDCIAQVWFRILHILGNPVDLSRQDVISKTPAFLKYAITSDFVIEPYQHPCLSQLPQIFLKAMKGVSCLVDAFLGLPVNFQSSSKQKEHHMGSFESRDAYNFNFNVAKQQVKGRAKCNSILHLFGPWLFEAALINCSFTSSLKTEHSTSSSLSTSGSHRRPTSVFLGENRKSSDPCSPSEGEKHPHLNSAHFHFGRAEALGALCRIFCSKKTGEEILPVYLARFYLALREGLQTREEFAIPLDDQKRGQIFHKPTCSETAASILLNGTNLFRLDLEGVVTLVPSTVGVLSAILLEYRDTSSGTSGTGSTSAVPSASIPMLRRAATHVLLSLLPLPLHFQGLCIKELNGPSNDRISLSQLRPQLVNLLSGALQVETDATNIQMLLAGLVFCVQDSTLCESVDALSHQTSVTERDSNVMSSAASDTLSSLGADGASLWGGGSDAMDNPSSLPPPLPAHLPSPDSAHGLYVRAIYLVSHCLMSSWTKEVNVSLAGLELLSSLALLNFGDQESDECKCAVKWLCDYIVFQCSRPPQNHSKDLHSMIVAAFHCASVWLVAHPYLLKDEECLSTVLEVIELGISGSKSQSKNEEPPKYKHEKELKPVSMRVRDAAEALLSCLLSQVSSFPSVCGVESLSSLLDEVTLLKHCNTYGGCGPLTKDTAIQHFRYFITQNSILLGLLEQPLVNHEDPQPTVTALIRGPFGRSAWAMQLRHLPRHKSSGKHYINNPGRPLPMNDLGIKHAITHKYFPESVERIPMCKADKSIPSLEQVIMSDDKSAIDHEKLLQIFDHQVAFEERMQRQMESESKYPDVDVECTPPPLCQEFQTARLLLSHLGFLSPESLQSTQSSSVPYLVALDTSLAGFTKDLENLDNTNNRTIDTIHLFYVKDGQTNYEDILFNVGPEGDVHPHFLEFLEGLGWLVDVQKHPGWTGHISTAFVSSPSVANSGLNEGKNGAMYSGRTHILYWADALSELAFIVPSIHHTTTTPADVNPLNHHLQPAHHLSLEGTSGGAGSQAGSEKSDSLPPLEMEAEGSSLSSHTSQVSTSGSENKSRRFGRQISTHSCNNHRVFVVWLESLDDGPHFPKNAFLPITATGLETASSKEKEIPIYIIFIHPLADGLFRINLDGHLNKLNLAGPLVDGQVVSRRVLGTLVRQTALNMCKRRRLESDSYQPPHVRRKFKVQDMVTKYRCEMDESEFYTHLFTSPLS